MLKLTDIQNRKLAEFLSDYSHFTTLSEEEQQKYLEAIVKMTEEKQEEVLKFLHEENEKEKVRMLKALNEKLQELAKVLKKIKTREEEAITHGEEEAQMANLEREIGNA